MNALLYDRITRSARRARSAEKRIGHVRSDRRGGRNSSIHSLRGARRPPRSAPPGRLLRLRRGRLAAAFFAFRRLLPAASAPAAASAAATAAPAVRRASRRALNVRAVRAGDLDGFRAAVVALLDRVLDRLFLLARRWASGWGVVRVRVRDGTGRSIARGGVGRTMDGGEPRSLNKYPKEGKGSDTDRSISTRRGSVRNARRTSRRERKPSA